MPLFVFALIKKHFHKSSQVCYRCVQVRSRADAILEIRCFERAAVVGPHPGSRKFCSDFRGTHKTAVAHAKGAEQRLADILFKLPAAGFLQNPAQHCDRCVGVLHARARFINQTGIVETGDHFSQTRSMRIKIAAHRRFAHKPGPVRHHLAQRDAHIKAVFRGKLRQEIANVRIEIEFIFLHELHNCHISKQLGDRPDAVHRAGSGRLLPVTAGRAKPLRPDDLLIIDQRNRKRGQIFDPHLVFDVILQLCHSLAVFRCRADRRALMAATRRQHQQTVNQGCYRIATLHFFHVLPPYSFCARRVHDTCSPHPGDMRWGKLKKPLSPV